METERAASIRFAKAHDVVFVVCSVISPFFSESNAGSRTETSGEEMEFPLKSDFFPPVRLTTEEKHNYVATAEYSVHVLRKLLRDDKWKRLSEYKGMTIGKVHCIEERSQAGPARACVIMCASVYATGSVSDVLEAIASPVTDDYRKAMAFLYKDRFIDGMCLHTIAPGGSRNTQAFTTIKWAAFKDIVPMQTKKKVAMHSIGVDYCFVEHSGMAKEEHCEDTFGFCIQESIVREAEVPAMPGFGLGRGELHRTGILIIPTERQDVIQIASILQMDTANTSKTALEKIMMRRVAAVNHVPLLLDRRRLSKMQFVSRDEWVRDEHRKSCVVCLKPFGLRRKHHCRNCGEVVCSTCAPPREVDVATYGIANIRICNACVVKSRGTSTPARSSNGQDVLVCHVRSTLVSQGSTNSSGMSIGDEGPALRQSSSSSDSNFSISSESSHGSNAITVAPSLSLMTDTSNEMTASMSLRDSGCSVRSSEYSFSDYNTIDESAWRVTSITSSSNQSNPSRPNISIPTSRSKQHVLYVPDDAENRAPNNRRLFYASASSTPTSQRDSTVSFRTRDSINSMHSRSSKQSSSSGSSASSLLDLLSSIREMKSDLQTVNGHYLGQEGEDPEQKDNHRARTPSRQLERLSEKLSETDLVDSACPTTRPRSNGNQFEYVRKQVKSTDPESQPRPDSNSLASTIDIDLLNSDSFSLICPTIHMEKQREDASRAHHQSTSGRRSTRISGLSVSSLFDEEDNNDENQDTRQTDLTPLPSQVEGRRGSVQDASKKLDYFQARSLVQEHVQSLEREMLELKNERRRSRAESATGNHDPEIDERETLYHALIAELHDIMGLPAAKGRATMSSDNYF
ncbi:hypothetical protein Poli38472_013479 [Pythium oligandrum]|uniref:FYVE-type domain-containing protein n=1 Tax=Pythium oligandrum TaxID=41045 RepID=A0A8K1FC73_PYTOL|nr:hypothetical protein Poli38472_013479 [Pythium oligandrum]|eukprot:TMW58005.1 hypothetical protein Poli38472_013479 [Pythium oligandrum]